MTPEVEEAILEIKQAFPGHQIDVEIEAQGGAYVVVHDLDIGEQYRPSATWIGFLIDFQYPRSDVYPHFIAANIGRADGHNHGAGFSGPLTWNGRQAFQISRRSKSWQPEVDSAGAKLLKVQKWISEQ